MNLLVVLFSAVISPILLPVNFVMSKQSNISFRILMDPGMSGWINFNKPSVSGILFSPFLAPNSWKNVAAFLKRFASSAFFEGAGQFGKRMLGVPIVSCLYNCHIFTFVMYADNVLAVLTSELIFKYSQNSIMTCTMSSSYPIRASCSLDVLNFTKWLYPDAFFGGIALCLALSLHVAP